MGGRQQGMWRLAARVVEVSGEVMCREILSIDERGLEQGGLRGKR